MGKHKLQRRQVNSGAGLRGCLVADVTPGPGCVPVQCYRLSHINVHVFMFRFRVEGLGFRVIVSLSLYIYIYIYIFIYLYIYIYIT